MYLDWYPDNNLSLHTQFHILSFVLLSIACTYVTGSRSMSSVKPLVREGVLM